MWPANPEMFITQSYNELLDKGKELQEKLNQWDCFIIKYT